MEAPDTSARYSRQVLFSPLGRAGQERLLKSRAAIVGAGALGAALGETLARAGVGYLRIIDRDVLESSNLGRQRLYTQRDVDEGLPKAPALRRHLLEFNPALSIEARVSDLNSGTAEELLGGVDLLLDGSDNFDTRYLINDFAVRSKLPWIYGACVGARGLTAVIRPGLTPCLRCLFPEPPPAGSAETCDTAGIIGPAADVVAALQATEALKLLSGNETALRKTLVSIELWPFRIFELGGPSPVPDPDCPACARREFPYLLGADRAKTLSYCGRNAVQIVPAGTARTISLDQLAARLSPLFPLRRNEFVLRIEVPGHSLTVFEDGRALISGTGDAATARSLYDRYIGA